MSRPDAERVLSREDLEQLRQNLEHPSEHGVESAYEVAYKECRLQGQRLPPAHALQQLVMAWKILRKWKRRPSAS